MTVPAQSRRKAALTFIFVTVLIDMLAFGMIIPVLPLLVQDFVGGNAAQAAKMYGLFGTAWALMQFIFSPVQGSLSDHFGRRPVLLISCAGLGLDFILMALAPNLWWLLLGRVRKWPIAALCTGIAGGCVLAVMYFGLHLFGSGRGLAVAFDNGEDMIHGCNPGLGGITKACAFTSSSRNCRPV